MTIYKVQKSYDENDKVYYDARPYNAKDSLYVHFKYCGGFKTLKKALSHCRLTENGAEKLVNKLNKKVGYNREY